MPCGGGELIKAEVKGNQQDTSFLLGGGHSAFLLFSWVGGGFKGKPQGRPVCLVFAFKPFKVNLLAAGI